MNVNPYIQLTFAVLAAGFVFADARRRRLAEAAAPHSDDDWEYTAPLPLPWTLLTLLLPQIGLAVYLAHVTRFRAAAIAGATAVVATVGVFKVFPTVELRPPWEEKSVPWSRLPPGLPRAVREATEKLSVELATRVIDVLPGLVEVGRSYPSGAEVSVKPDANEAQVLLEINHDEFIEMAAVRIFRSADAAERALAKDPATKGARKMRLASGEMGLQRGPERVKDGSDGAHVVELFVRRDDVVFDVLLQEAAPLSAQFTASRKSALEAELKTLMDKMSKAIPSTQ